MQRARQKVPGSGRKVGTPNRNTVQAIERLRDLDADPLEELVAIARNLKTPIEVCARIWIEIAQFIYPKRKAVDLQAVNASGVSLIQVHWGKADEQQPINGHSNGTVRRIASGVSADLPPTNGTGKV